MFRWQLANIQVALLVVFLFICLMCFVYLLSVVRLST